MRISGSEKLMTPGNTSKTSIVFTPGLLRRLCDAQNSQAWDEFAVAFSPGIRAAIRRVLVARGVRYQPDDIDEIYQEVFLRLIRHDFQLLHSYEPSRGASFATWLNMVARSVTLDFLKQQPSASFTSLEAAAEIAAPTASYQDALEFTAGVLSQREEQILRFLIEKELSPEKIAEKLEIEVTTVYIHKRNAINKLRKNMRAAMEPE
jgi:RNA polymerase sigma factor (sigma-70 family)